MEWPINTIRFGNKFVTFLYFLFVLQELWLKNGIPRIAVECGSADIGLGIKEGKIKHMLSTDTCGRRPCLPSKDQID